MKIQMRRSKKAKRILIRVSAEHGVELVLPMRAREQDALNFLHERSAWIQKTLEKEQVHHQVQKPVELYRGAILPCFGDTQELDAIVSSKRAYTPEQMIVKVSRWYIQEAKAYFTIQAQEFADVLHEHITNIRVINMKTQWGSCNRATTSLTFNWRLALAPEEVARYVAAHEVAHLVYGNHGKKFWKLVGTLDQSYARHRVWLKKYGGGLYIIFKKSP